MNKELYNKCLKADFEKILANKGYVYFDKGEYNLNIIGVRANTNKEITNKFNDCLVVIYNTGKGYRKDIYAFTTDPGLYYMKYPLSKNGCAILVPNQYRGCYAIGKHRGYTALVQVKPVQVYRDNNKNDIYDLIPSSIEGGLFGINIHRSVSNGKTNSIDKYSAGCQVVADSVDYSNFIANCQIAKGKWGNSFTYTLLDEADL